MIKTISINGFRGFGEQQRISFALPDGEQFGSGLSVIIGANNSGKTTIIEAVKAFNHYSHNGVFFSEGRRNKNTEGRVELSITTDDEEVFSIHTVDTGGAATVSTQNQNLLSSYIVPSRRAFPVYFYKNYMDRQDYIHNSMQLEQLRSSDLQEFNARIFEIDKRKDEFDPLIMKILGSDFEWQLELSDSGQYYIKYCGEENSHSGDGVGDGVWSVFTICAALFDSEPGSTIVIDEPELSLHPSLQKRLMLLLMEYASDRQIILCTHSPYYINWDAIVSGSFLIRVSKEGGNTHCYSINDENRKFFKSLITDIHNPHTLGLNAREALFTEDRLILVEGQEDVVIYKRIIKDLNLSIEGEFFGWGAGGESKIEGFLKLFDQLGYKKVVAIYDGDKKDEANTAQQNYPKYKIFIIPENDVRDKDERTIEEKKGIASKNGKLKEKYEHEIKEMFNDIGEYFKS